MPQLVNRGPAGLLKKLGPKEKPKDEGEAGEAGTIHATTIPPPAMVPVEMNKIAPAFAGQVVDIALLNLDPNNAKLHPDRNMQAIKDSLTAFGQVKPVVVRREGMVVLAGNGTTQAAKELGWTKLAVSIVDMTEAEAAAYGLADNRTSELGKWDFEVVTRLDKLITEAGLPMPGWTSDELQVLRAADWTPPAAHDEEFGKKKDSHLSLVFSQKQYDVVVEAVDLLRHLEPVDSDKELSQAECLERICYQWLGQLEEKLVENEEPASIEVESSSSDVDSPAQVFEEAQTEELTGVSNA